MAIFSKLRRQKTANLASAIVVDLANIRVPVVEDEKVLMGNKLQDPFLFEYIDQIKADIDNLGCNVPVFLVLDSLVTPNDMTEEEQREFNARLNSSIFDQNHIWRVGKEYQKADYPICDLVNNLGAMVISSDRFKDHIENGNIHHPEELLQFSPRRSSRFVAHKFVNVAFGGRKKTPQDLLTQTTNDDEYWNQWLEHAKIIISYLDPEAEKAAEDEIEDSHFNSTTPVHEVEIEEQLAPVVVQREYVDKPRKRPEQVPIVYCGDFLSLNRSVDSYVQVIGRLFRDGTNWELRDIASAQPVKANGAPKFKGFSVGQWIGCEGVLQRNNIGYYLESPEWIPVSDVKEISFTTTNPKKRRTIFRSWGPPPWAKSHLSVTDDEPFDVQGIEEPINPPIIVNPETSLVPDPKTPSAIPIDVSTNEVTKETSAEPPLTTTNSANTSMGKSPTPNLQPDPIGPPSSPKEPTTVTSAEHQVQIIEDDNNQTAAHEKLRTKNRNLTPWLIAFSVAIAAVVSALLLIF